MGSTRDFRKPGMAALQQPLEVVKPGRGRKCVHHWMLGDPAEGWIRGACQRCGAKKKFPAALESTQRFDDYRELTATTSYMERISA